MSGASKQRTASLMQREPRLQRRSVKRTRLGAPLRLRYDAVPGFLPRFLPTPSCRRVGDRGHGLGSSPVREMPSTLRSVLYVTTAWTLSRIPSLRGKRDFRGFLSRQNGVSGCLRAPKRRKEVSIESTVCAFNPVRDALPWMRSPRKRRPWQAPRPHRPSPPAPGQVDQG